MIHRCGLRELTGGRVYRQDLSQNKIATVCAPGMGYHTPAAGIEKEFFEKPAYLRLALAVHQGAS